MKDENISISIDMWTKINNVNIGEEKLSKVYYKNKYSHTRLFMWDTRNFSDIFINEFQLRPQDETLDSVYYKLYDYMILFMREACLLVSEGQKNHVFVTTSVNSS